MTTRRRLLAVAAGGALSVAGCLGSPAADGGDSTATPADGPVASAPSGDASATYPVMGTAGPRITYFGSWKCPYCARFEEEVMGGLVSDYVEPGALRLQYLPVAYRANGDPFLGPDAPRAAQAGLAVWAADPTNYWRYHATVYANQPPEDEAWATTDRLVEFARIAGVEPLDAVRSATESGTYESQLREAARRAFDEVGIRGTPTLVIDGEQVPALDEERVREAIDALVAE